MSTKATITKPAPQFKETAVVGQEFKEISLADYKDFTFVCPTEIIAFSDRVEEFRKVNAEVIGISVDSKYTHLAWVNTPRKDSGLGKINIPLVADITKSISTAYDVLLEDGFTLRGTFIIDGKGILRQITKNDRPVGRSVDETLRLIHALQFTDTHGDEVCPANWKPGDVTMVSKPTESKEYFSKVNH